ncbi:MAG: prefoldin subunit [Desulfurococcales archaeon]|nr:prefoldin subunit [Desulfurococcales archaeon]
MVEKAPAEVLRAKYKKFEELRAQLNKILQAEATTARSLEEAKTVLEEVKKLPDDTELYKQVGFVLVPVKKEELVKELEAKIEELEALRAKYEKMRKEIEEDLNRLMEEIRKLAQSQGGSVLGG